MAESELLTLYDYFTTDGGIKSGLSDSDHNNFKLNGKPFTIYSGSVHYFRIPKEYWRDRLKKCRASGLNTISTYVPWNLHEYKEGVFDFGKGGSDYENFLDISTFLQIAKEEDLFVILRPGPYICAEWDFGGLPSWLLRYKDMKIRTNDPKYIQLVERFFKRLFDYIKHLQFTKGGPIIAVQVENEYGNLDDHINPLEVDHLTKIKEILEENGVVELLFTSDTPSNGFSGTLPEVLATANFQTEPDIELKLLKDFQPNKPAHVSEFWAGWFDHWGDKHHTTNVADFRQVLEDILNFPASVNFYMFHGGTNWGFLNGANLEDKSIIATDNAGFKPDVTSYDYDAPLSESGDYTPKYHAVKEIIAKYNKLPILTPELPVLEKKVIYPEIKIIGELPIIELINQSRSFPIESLIPMEMLPINEHNGQSYGYIVYRKRNLKIPENAILQIEGRVCDTCIVLVDGLSKNKPLKSKESLNGFGYWKQKDSVLKLEEHSHENATIDILVENWGRVNYGFLNQFNQYKGLWQGKVLLNNEDLKIDEAIPLEFKKTWLAQLKDWQEPKFNMGPCLYKASLQISDPKDTYIDMRKWCKGFVVVNNFIIGRYCQLGPQKSLYLPAPFLKHGKNDILIFEHFLPYKTVTFTDKLINE